uniref:Uncharacterized protein n=1 Tax=Panagrolaimus sp. JU765 TaxID=591449 RepID=A0AC34QB98_9BILA
MALFFYYSEPENDELYNQRPLIVVESDFLDGLQNDPRTLYVAFETTDDEELVVSLEPGVNPSLKKVGLM